MALQITINGNDKTSLVLWPSLNWTQALTNEVDTLEFKIQKFGARTFAPIVLDEVKLYVGGTLVFGGNIVAINEEVVAADRQIYSVIVKDYQHLLDRRLVIEQYTATPVVNIISDLLNKYINKGQRIEIASFEATEVWSGGAADTTHYRVGSQGWLVASTNAVLNSASRVASLNLEPTGWAASDYIDIDVYVDAAANLGTATIKLGDSTLASYFSKNITSLLATGYTRVHVLKSAFSSTGAPSWSAITKLMLEVTSVAGTTVNVTFDNWQAVQATAFTCTGSLAASQVVNYISFSYSPPSTCLQRMADLFQWNWYVDENKDVKFFAKFDVGAPFNLTDTGGKYVYESLKINSNADQLRNSIYVRGGDYIGASVTENLKHQADGVNKIFKLGYKYSEGYTLTLNGTEKAVGINNVDGYASNEGARQITNGAGPLNLGDLTANTSQAQQVIMTRKGRVDTIRLRIKKVGAPVDDLQIQVFGDNGANTPSVTALSTIKPKNGATITTNFAEYSLALTEFATNTLLLAKNAKYHIVANRSGGIDASNYYVIDAVGVGVYEGLCNTYGGASWGAAQASWYFIEQLAFDALYSIDEKVFIFNSTPSAGDTVTWLGAPFLPVFVWYRDNSSIGTYGEFQNVIVDKSILNKDAARQRAYQEILAWASEASEGQFLTYQDGLKVGQTINVQSTQRGFADNYIINRVVARARSHQALEYTVGLMTTKTYGILYWLQQQIAKDNREIEIDQNELLDKIEAIIEEFAVGDSYALTLYSGKVWSNDGGTTPNKLVWDGGADHIWI